MPVRRTFLKSVALHLVQLPFEFALTFRHWVQRVTSASKSLATISREARPSCTNLRTGSTPTAAFLLMPAALNNSATTAVKRLVLGGDWVTRTIASLRWQLIQIAGKVVRHGRRLILRVQERHYDLRSSIRQKLTAMAAVATPT